MFEGFEEDLHVAWHGLSCWVVRASFSDRICSSVSVSTSNTAQISHIRLLVCVPWIVVNIYIYIYVNITGLSYYSFCSCFFQDFPCRPCWPATLRVPYGPIISGKAWSLRKHVSFSFLLVSRMHLLGRYFEPVKLGIGVFFGGNFDPNQRNIYGRVRLAMLKESIWWSEDPVI